MSELKSIRELPASLDKLILPANVQVRKTSLTMKDLAAEILSAVYLVTDPLEKRIKELEENSMQYRGTWQPDTQYANGSAVTFDGSLWCALSANKGEKPGPSISWRLCVKRGRDGKDAR